jgi:hypothetical protein
MVNSAPCDFDGIHVTGYIGVWIVQN